MAGEKFSRSTVPLIAWLRPVNHLSSRVSSTILPAIDLWS